MIRADHPRFYDRVSAVYDELIGCSSFARARRVLAWAIPRLRAFPCPAADLGCGTGLFVRHVRDLGCRPVYGVDRSTKMLEHACRRDSGGDSRFFRQDLRELHLPTQVSLMTAHADVINHLLSPGDLMQAFARIRAAMSPTGAFLFDVVTHDTPPPRHWTYTRSFPSHRLSLIEVGRWDPHTGLLGVRCFIHPVGGVAREIAGQVERTYRLVEVVQALERTGFRWLDGVQAAALSPHREPWSRQIVAARAR